MVLLIMLLSEIASIAIYIIMSTQNAFGEVLPKWKGEWDDRTMSLFLAAVFAGWFLAPYFAWLMWKWIKKKEEREEEKRGKIN